MYIEYLSLLIWNHQIVTSQYIVHENVLLLCITVYCYSGHFNSYLSKFDVILDIIGSYVSVYSSHHEKVHIGQYGDRTHDIRVISTTL